MKDHHDSGMLPRELVWDGAHVSELALTAIADGQHDIVQKDAVAHAEACEWCAGRMGRAALLSSAVGSVIIEQAERKAVSQKRAKPAPAPWKALTLGVAVAVLAAIPSMPHFAGIVVDALGYLKLFSTHGLGVLVRGGVAIATNQTIARGLPAATAVSSVLLVAMGFAIARSRSRETFERSMS